ncbi:adenylyl cyclase X E-like, partial [Drosophila navojoa]|uniref:adenylyl cyclase X E-like n=1 Tax=Drosophila navojoa TaxID=7232 RepID=UPI0011BD567A
MMCTYFLIMREIVVRASFIDRHQYVMEDIALKSARATEKIFLHTILPRQIAQPIQDEIRNRIKISQKHHDLPFNNRRDRVIAIQMHPDVSILYADI